jgi:hypothetical protein
VKTVIVGCARIERPTDLIIHLLDGHELLEIRWVNGLLGRQGVVDIPFEGIKKLV